jgi:predicted esterase
MFTSNRRLALGVPEHSCAGFAVLLFVAGVIVLPGCSPSASASSRNWAYVGVTYLDATGSYDDEPAASANLKAALDEIRQACDFGSPSVFLGGFSRGSAMTFGIAYRRCSRISSPSGDAQSLGDW